MPSSRVVELFYQNQCHKLYKADEEAVHELNKCHNLLKDMEHSSDMRYPYNWNDKLINNYVYSVALLWEYPKRHSVKL